MKIAIAVIVAVLVIGGGYFLFANKTLAPVTNPEMTSGNSAPVETTNPNTQGGANSTGVSASVTTTVTASAIKTITYDGTSFSPASITIKKGDTVKFVDSTGSGMWVASNPHPAHTGYSGTTKDQHCPDVAGTAFDQCSPGTSYIFTFQKVGSWGYHNHLNHAVTGMVVVTP